MARRFGNKRKQLPARRSTSVAKRGRAVSTFVRRPRGIYDRSPINMGWAEVVPKKGLSYAKKVASTAARSPLTKINPFVALGTVAAAAALTFADDYQKRVQAKRKAAEAKLAAAYKTATGRSIAQSSVNQVLYGRKKVDTAAALTSALSAVSSYKKTSTKKSTQAVKPTRTKQTVTKKPSKASVSKKPSVAANKAKVQKIIASDRKRAGSWTWNGGSTPNVKPSKKSSTTKKTSFRSAKADFWDDILNL